MPAPVRIHHAVLVLVPSVEMGQRDVMNIGRQACRMAHGQGLLPIFPFLYYAGFLTEEELDRELNKQYIAWSKRAGRIWICAPEFGPLPFEEIKLDPLTHRILLDNEGLLSAAPKRHDDASRLPVYVFSRLDNGARVNLATRKEVSSMLMCSLSTGMFKGVAA